MVNAVLMEPKTKAGVVKRTFASINEKAQAGRRSTLPRRSTLDRYKSKGL